MTETLKTTNSPRVTILMGVHNGAAHLPQQLHSIARQTHKNWQLRISDDGSTDESHGILERFADDHPGKVRMVKGPQKGFCENYLSLLRALDPNDGYICFADQDDIWLPDKIARSLNILMPMDDQVALSCGRHWYWHDQSGRKVASSPLTRPFGMRNALIENVASGNTVMLNPAAARLAKRAAARIGPVFAHDWWLYLLVTGTGGNLAFDNGPPTILYRQHAGNAIGAGRGLTRQFARKLGVLRGAFSHRIEGNLQALFAIEDMLTEDAQTVLDAFANARTRRGMARLKALHSVAPYRQRKAHTLGFWGAASLGRI